MFPIREEQRNTSEALPTANTLQKLLAEVNSLIVANLSQEFLAAEGADVVELARAFVALRQLKDKLEEVTKSFGNLFEKAKGETLPGAFERAGVPSVNLDEGFRITVRHDVRASIKAGMKLDAMRWLKDHGLESIVSETVNSSTLAAVARTKMEEGQELEPELFSVHVLPTMSVTKR